MAVFAYMRVSTADKGQTTDNQKKLIVDAGFAIDEFVSEDGVSGSKKAFERPAFSAMMKKAKEGDTIITTAVDRLGRNAMDVLSVVEEFKARGIRLRIVALDAVDLTSPTGKLLLTMLAGIAEMEKAFLIERTKAGLARTKEQGTKLGRAITVKPSDLRAMVAAKNSGKSYVELEEAFGIPRNTINRNILKWGNNLDGYEKEWAGAQAQYAAKAA